MMLLIRELRREVEQLRREVQELKAARGEGGERRDLFRPRDGARPGFRGGERPEGDRAEPRRERDGDRPREEPRGERIERERERDAARDEPRREGEGNREEAAPERDEARQEFRAIEEGIREVDAALTKTPKQVVTEVKIRGFLDKELGQPRLRIESISTEKVPKPDTRDEESADVPGTE